MPVGVSVNGEQLRYSDPAYLETLARGVSFILWGLLAMIVVMVGAGVLGFLAGIPFVIGGWMLTTPDPSGLGEKRYGTSRQIIRISIALGLLNNLISFIAATVGPLRPAAHTAFSLVEMIFSLVEMVGIIAQLLYLRALALRIPDHSLSDRAATVMWGFGISYGLYSAGRWCDGRGTAGSVDHVRCLCRRHFVTRGAGVRNHVSGDVGALRTEF
jgi:hypothetical protein